MTCVKCGSETIHTQWHQGNYWSVSYAGRGCLRFQQQTPDEHLHYTCQVCHFDWSSPTLDAA